MGNALLSRLFATQLVELLDAEARLGAALPRLVGAARDEAVREALGRQLADTRRHMLVLAALLRVLDIEAAPFRCVPMQALLARAERVTRSGAGHDAALLQAARRIELFEVGSFEAAITRATQLGLELPARSLGRALDEKLQTSRRLSELAADTASASGR